MRNGSNSVCERIFTSSKIGRRAERRYPLFLLVAVLILLLSACSGRPSKPAVSTVESATSRYLPLNLGYTWEYRRTMIGETGTLTVSIVSRDNEGFFVDNQGGRFMHTPRGLRDADRYLLQMPLDKGNSWRVQISPVSAEHFQITDDDAAVAVPAGTFKNCLVVRSLTRLDAERTLINQITYAPDVGMVRAQTDLIVKDQAPVTQVLLELVRYELPGYRATPGNPAPNPSPDAADQSTKRKTS